MTDNTEPAPEGPSEPAWYNHSERLELDRWHGDQRFALEARQAHAAAATKALEFAVVYHRDIGRTFLLPKEDGPQPATPDEVVATAEVFRQFIDGAA